MPASGVSTPRAGTATAPGTPRHNPSRGGSAASRRTVSSSRDFLLSVLAPGRGGEPFISPHLKRMRPFLARGDFAPGSFGHDLIADLQPSDLRVEKVAFSAFYQSRMEWMLTRAGISTLIFGGIVTNGGVASTVRDAHVRDFHTIVLADGCAAFSQSAHDASIAALGTISTIATVDEIVTALGG